MAIFIKQQDSNYRLVTDRPIEINAIEHQINLVGIDIVKHAMENTIRNYIDIYRRDKSDERTSKYERLSDTDKQAVDTILEKLQ